MKPIYFTISRDNKGQVRLGAGFSKENPVDAYQMARKKKQKKIHVINLDSPSLNEDLDIALKHIVGESAKEIKADIYNILRSRL